MLPEQGAMLILRIDTTKMLNFFIENNYFKKMVIHLFMSRKKFLQKAIVFNTEKLKLTNVI